MADKPGNPTLYDVARAAGVSLATASRSLNGSARRVNNEYRDRVLKAAEQLGYTANLSAQAVAKGASNTVALLVSDISDPYFSSIAAGVMRSATAEGLMVIMVATDRDSQREVELVRLLRGQRPRIIVLAGSRVAGDPAMPSLVEQLDTFADSGGRVVAISQAELPFDTVVIANQAGGAALASELLALGYRRFGILAGPPDLLTARDRSDAFIATLAKAGVTPIAVQHGEFTRSGGHRAVGELLDSIESNGDSNADPGIDIVFAVNDVMAIGAMAALRERGVSVPEELSIAGFDDIPSARDVFPNLTTVHLDLEAAGERAIELALLAGKKDPAIALIDAVVVIRDSSPTK